MADDLLDHIEHVAELVHGMRTKRRKVSTKVRDLVGDRDSWVCRICDEHVDRNLPWLSGPRPDPLGPGLNDRYPSVEHVVPVSMGGTNDETNLAICHYGCNAQRGRDGRQAGNHVQIRAATAATQVLKAASVLRGAGWDPEQNDESMPWQDVETLVEFLKASGRRTEVPGTLQEWLRALDRRTSGRGYLWGTVERLERQAAERRAQSNNGSGA